MNKLIKVFLLTLFVNLNFLFTESSTDLTLEFVTAGIKYNNSLIKSVKVEYDVYIIKNGQKTTTKHKEIWIKKGDKEYLQTKRFRDGNLILFDEVAYNGQKGMTLLHSQHPKIPDSGVIYTGKPLPLDERFTWGNLYQEIWQTDISRRLEKDTIISFSKDTQSEKTYYIIHGKDKDTGLGYRVWVDPKRSFRFIKIQHIGLKGNVVSEIYPIELKEFAGGIWFPVKAIIKDPDSGLVNECIATKIEINSEIPDEIFTLQYKKGTDIWDDSMKFGFTIK